MIIFISYISAQNPHEFGTIRHAPNFRFMCPWSKLHLENQNYRQEKEKKKKAHELKASHNALP